MHLYDEYKDIYHFEHFLKHSRFGDILILLFACSYVAEQKSHLSKLDFLKLLSEQFLTLA